MLGRTPAFKKEQFIPIGQVTVTPFAVMVNAESRWKTFQEFVDEARQKPDEFQYASAGVYSTTHFMWEMILKATGVRVRHMPTTGGGPIMMAVLGKHVDIGHCVVPAVCAPQVEAKKIRLLAMTSDKRLPAYPDVPTLKELGYDVTHSIWHTLMVPAGTPPEVVAKLRQGLKAMVDDEAFKSLMGKLGERVQYMSGEDFEKWWDAGLQEGGRAPEAAHQEVRPDGERSLPSEVRHGCGEADLRRFARERAGRSLGGAHRQALSRARATGRREPARATTRSLSDVGGGRSRPPRPGHGGREETRGTPAILPGLDVQRRSPRGLGPG